MAPPLLDFSDDEDVNVDFKSESEGEYFDIGEQRTPPTPDIEEEESGVAEEERLQDEEIDTLAEEHGLTSRPRRGATNRSYLDPSPEASPGAKQPPSIHSSPPLAALKSALPSPTLTKTPRKVTFAKTPTPPPRSSKKKPARVTAAQPDIVPPAPPPIYTRGEMERSLDIFNVPRHIPNTRVAICKHIEETTVRKRNAYLFANRDIFDALLPSIPARNFFKQKAKQDSNYVRSLPEVIGMGTVTADKRITHDLSDYQSRAFRKLLFFHDNGVNSCINVMYGIHAEDRQKTHTIKSKMIAALASALMDPQRKGPENHHRPFILVTDSGDPEKIASEIKSWEYHYYLEVLHFSGGKKDKDMVKAVKEADIIVVDAMTFKTEFNFLDAAAIYRYLILDVDEHMDDPSRDPMYSDKLNRIRSEYRMILGSEPTPTCFPELAFLYPEVYNSDNVRSNTELNENDRKVQAILKLISISLDEEKSRRAFKRGIPFPAFPKVTKKPAIINNEVDKHQNFCQACLYSVDHSLNETMDCSVCPRTYHVDELCLSQVDRKIIHDGRKAFKCAQHRCAFDFMSDNKCGESSVYFCRTCPRGYCEEHFNFLYGYGEMDGREVSGDGLGPRFEGFEIPEYEDLEFGPRRDMAFMLCGVCRAATDYDPEKLVWFEDLKEQLERKGCGDEHEMPDYDGGCRQF